MDDVSVSLERTAAGITRENLGPALDRCTDRARSGNRNTSKEADKKERGTNKNIQKDTKKISTEKNFFFGVSLVVEGVIEVFGNHETQQSGGGKPGRP